MIPGKQLLLLLDIPNNSCSHVVHSPLQVAMGERYTDIVRKPRWDLWTLGHARADGSAPIKMPSITSKWGATDSIWCAEMEPHLVGDNNPPPLVDKLLEVRFCRIAATRAWEDSSACARVWYCQIFFVVVRFWSFLPLMKSKTYQCSFWLLWPPHHPHQVR